MKKPVFGGACKLCPWGAMAEIVKEAMKPYSYDVQICYNCNRADSPRIVAEARMPPPYEQDQAVSAATAASGITDLSQIRDRGRPVRILMGHGAAQEVLSYYGLTREMIEEAGGYVGNSRETRKNFDVIIHGAGGLSTAPEWDVWYEVTQRFDLHYIELPDEIEPGANRDTRNRREPRRIL